MSWGLWEHRSWQPSQYYLFQSIPAAQVQSAGCGEQPYCWEQCSHIKASCSTDLSNVGEASPWMALLLSALVQTDIPSLPRLLYTPPHTRNKFSVPMHSRELQQHHYSLFPTGFLKTTSTFLIAITQHCPCYHTSDIHFSASCLSNTRRLTPQRLYSCMTTVENDCTTCRDRVSTYKLQEWAWLSELPVFAWVGVCLKPILLAFLPNWQWRKQCKRNTAKTSRNLAYFILCARSSWAFWSSILYAESPYQQLGTPGCLRLRMCFPLWKQQHIPMYVCGSWGQSFACMRKVHALPALLP